jgi:hypothetical protein
MAGTSILEQVKLISASRKHLGNLSHKATDVEYHHRSPMTYDSYLTISQSPVIFDRAPAQVGLGPCDAVDASWSHAQNTVPFILTKTSTTSLHHQVLCYSAFNRIFRYY